MNWCSFVKFFQFLFLFRNRLRDAFVKHLGESSKVCTQLAFVNRFFLIFSLESILPSARVEIKPAGVLAVLSNCRREKTRQCGQARVKRNNQ